MGHRARIKVGNYFFEYVKDSIPLSWVLIFDNINEVSITSVKNAKDKLRNANIKIGEVEFHLSYILGNSKLSENRRENLLSTQEVYGNLVHHFKDLSENSGMSNNDLDDNEEVFVGKQNNQIPQIIHTEDILCPKINNRYPEIIQSSNNIEESKEDIDETNATLDTESVEETTDSGIGDEPDNFYDTGYLSYEAGVPEISALYHLLLSIEFSSNTDEIILDMEDLFGLFGTDDKTSDRYFIQLAQEHFIDKYSALQYMYLRFIADKNEIESNFEYIQKLSENDFINIILVPLFKKMAFTNVTRNMYHGPDEEGIDIGPFFKNEYNQLLYYGIQVKSVKIHTNSRKIDGNAELILTQLRKAINHEFALDNGTKVKLFNVFLITSKEIIPSAKAYIQKSISNVILIDGYGIAELAIKYNMRYF